MVEMALEKEQLREASVGLPHLPVGKVAQALRRFKRYRQSKVVFVDGSANLQQVRINALLDGKQLCMPSPALKKGFFLCRPFTIPFADLPFALSLKGIEKFGQPLAALELESLAVDLAICEVVAIDSGGRRLGDGTGFFDLALGILGSYGGLREEWAVGAVIGEGQLQVGPIPMAPWDVAMDFAIGVEEEILFPGRRKEPTVIWSALATNKIRKLDLLWQLRQQRWADA